MGLYVLRFCFWVQVKVRVKGWVGLMSTAQLRSDLQRWFLDTRVGRIHRWHKSQCDHELLSAQMLHRLKKNKQKHLLLMFIPDFLILSGSQILDVRFYATFTKQRLLLVRKGHVSIPN